MLKEGLNTIKTKTVSESDSAKKYASGTIDVFATPAMIAFMEETSHHCIEQHLQKGQSSVGIHVDVKHLKATPIGMKVKCEAQLIKVEGKKLSFTVTAWDETEKIGEGTHMRYIIDSEAFLKALELKINQK